MCLFLSNVLGSCDCELLCEDACWIMCAIAGDLFYAYVCFACDVLCGVVWCCVCPVIVCAHVVWFVCFLCMCLLYVLVRFVFLFDCVMLHGAFLFCAFVVECFGVMCVFNLKFIVLFCLVCSFVCVCVGCCLMLYVLLLCCFVCVCV